MCGYMGFMKCCRVDNKVRPQHALPHNARITYRANVSRKRGINQIESQDLVPPLLKGPDDAFPEMPSTSGYQYTHGRPFRTLFSDCDKLGAQFEFSRRY